MPLTPSPTFLFTIDVEDWFHVENFKPWISRKSWPQRQLRIEKNIDHILAFLNDFKSTFFILGWVAAKIPQLVRQIADHGHEVASHGYNHQLCPEMNPRDLKQDLLRSKQLLEDIIGSEVIGYRAPSFSVNHQVLMLLEQCGYRYDSSYNSFSANPRYGHLDMSRYEQNRRGIRITKNLHELPLSNLTLLNRILPWSGGGYFRLLPYSVFRQGVRNLLAHHGYYMFYLHPWEIDHLQPKVKAADKLSRFRHYWNLKSTRKKLRRLLQDHSHCRFTTCRAFLHLQ